MALESKLNELASKKKAPVMELAEIDVTGSFCCNIIGLLSVH